MCASVPVSVLPPQGFVYLKFDTPTAAQAAKQVLHGRFYNGHRIEAEFQFVQMYNTFFGQT